MSSTTTNAVPGFDPGTFGDSVSFAVIGVGHIGDKATGLRTILERVLGRFDASGFDGVKVFVPRVVVVATDVFSEFMERNGLWKVLREDLPDSRIARDFAAGELPQRVREDLKAYLQVVRSPLFIRPSSHLEADDEAAAAGIFTSKIVPNSEDDDGLRYRRLSGVLKLAWASPFFSSAVISRRAAGLADDAEKMAVMIQEVVGRRHGGRFYPTLSAVARSFNHYPTPGNKREDGVVSVALGLGKTITDGGHVWSYSPHRPTAPPPYKGTAELLKFTQNSFWAINVGDPPPPDPQRETSCLVRCGLRDAEEDGTLTHLVSTYDPESDRLQSGLTGDGPRALTFAPLLESRSIPFTPVVERLLELSCVALNGEAEIELAVDFGADNGLPVRLALVQLRPMLTPAERTPVEEGELEDARVVVASDNCLGQGARSDLTDIVYLRPESFDRGLTRMMASELDAVNRGLVEEGRKAILIGLGRWGTTDERFGVPVKWAQISASRVIVESTLLGTPATLSHGTHFFHRLLSHQVLYMSVEGGGRGKIDYDWLDQQEAVWESRNVRHVRVDEPLDVRIDCATRRGLVRRVE